MAQEDQEQTLTGSLCDSAGGGSGGGGGGNNKPSKNGKPKKVPQRGKKKQKVDPGFTFHGESMLRNESTNSPFLSALLNNVPQRSHQIQQPSSSVVNASTEINSPSALISSQMELPSNQILPYNSDYTSSSLEEDKENLRSQVDHTFSFFPDKSNTDETSKSIKNGNGETGEWIDLKLKL
ncbi:hypothetical protein MIMGU_mgv1a014761mg [Erythranthe guttata]|uniref:Uncharacterized protein n=1 Tax=Erythranthe guttata TaxID=4155 RepID=A0A022S1A2_ERYGU|nr:hypothetical protein MIMGU_mgv1a014761mg [Erythranthe guttata]